MPRPPPDPGLYRKLVWLTAFRVVTVTVLLGGTAVVSWQEGGEADAVLAPIYALVVAGYAGSAVFAFALRRRAGLVPTAYAQIALDVLVAAGLVRITGGTDSVFLFLFALATVNGSVLLFRRGALTASALAVPAYLALALTQPGGVSGATAFGHAAAFVATAVLASYLAEQLRSTGELLAERESDLAVITALHEAVVQSMPGGLMTLDAAGAVTFANPAAEQMTGLPAAAARGRPAAELLPGFEPGAARDELEVVNARGERLRIGYSSFGLVTPAGAPIGTALVFQDLTRLREMEEAVQRSERLADLGRLAAGLAHELRNPLASMSGSIELLRGGAAASEEDRRLMDIVLREAARLNELVTGFLQFARPVPLRREGVDLACLLDETVAVFRHDPAAAGLELDTDLARTPVSCDPAQLRQVVWNLLVNAAQALDGREGGRRGRVAIRCRLDEVGCASFSVEDDGPGVPAAERERIFLPFHTTKDRGTGLGLSTVHRVIDAHGGRVTVDSPPGAGARFTVHLPPP